MHHFHGTSLNCIQPSRRTVALGGLGITTTLLTSRSWAWDGPVMDLKEAKISLPRQGWRL